MNEASLGPIDLAVAGAQESGTNVWLLGVLSFGEGFHNNHHAFPQSARMGLSYREPDLGWGVIALFTRLGWMWNVRSAAPGRGGRE